MLNKIIKFSLDHKLFILLAAILLIVAGLWSANRTDIDVFPDLTAPQVVVMTDAVGMAPEEVERLVTFPIDASALPLCKGAVSSLSNSIGVWTSSVPAK